MKNISVSKFTTQKIRPSVDVYCIQLVDETGHSFFIDCVNEASRDKLFETMCDALQLSGIPVEKYAA